MASTSSVSATQTDASSAIDSAFASFSTPWLHSSTIGVQLEGPNYVVWKTRILPYLRASGLLPVVDGTAPCPSATLSQAQPDGTVQVTPNPEYRKWITRDQTALGWILNTSSNSMVLQLAKHKTSNAAWEALATDFARQSSAKAPYLYMKLQDLCKGSSSVTDFLHEFISITDQLEATGKRVSENLYNTNIFRGLGPEFTQLEVALSVRSYVTSTSISREDLHGLLLAHEARLYHAARKVAAPPPATFAPQIHHSPAQFPSTQYPYWPAQYQSPAPPQPAPAPNAFQAPPLLPTPQPTYPQ